MFDHPHEMLREIFELDTHAGPEAQVGAFLRGYGKAGEEPVRADQTYHRRALSDD